MPTVSVVRDWLFESLGRTFTYDEFDELCFEFGIELEKEENEKIATPSRAGRVSAADAADAQEYAIHYKLDIGANRYDLLCLEGLVQALRVFTGVDSAPPHYALSTDTPAITVAVQPPVDQIRQFVVCAVLRGITLDAQRYQSLIGLQDKLHQNVCRKRTLVSVGTHDMSKVQGTNLTYTAKPPESISFVPLGMEQELHATELMTHYESDMQMKGYLPIIRDSPVYPVFMDQTGAVLSLPPIVNSDHCKITEDTTEMLIECTATDLTKAKIVLNTLVAMYSGYCGEKYTVEPVRVVYADGTEMVTPDLSKVVLEASHGRVQTLVGAEISVPEVKDLLRKMQLEAETVAGNDDLLQVSVPITRTDVLHECDIVEDVAIAYGFNNIVERELETRTEGKPLALNQLADMVRREGFSVKGYTEVLTWVTVSLNENFNWMQRVDDNETAVKLSNPKTQEFQACRSSLLPGILKTLRENRGQKLPLRLFEVGDVLLLDPEREVGARNLRHMAAVVGSTVASFEVIKDLLDHVMMMLGCHAAETAYAESVGESQLYRLDAAGCTDDALFAGRRANVLVGGVQIGVIGWVHPNVLEKFSLDFPCSALELNLEHFL